MPIVLCLVFDLLPCSREQRRVFLGCRRGWLWIVRGRLSCGRLESGGCTYPRQCRTSGDLVSTECKRRCETGALANRCKQNRLLVLRTRQPYRHWKSMHAWNTKLVGFAKTTRRCVCVCLQPIWTRHSRKHGGSTSRLRRTGTATWMRHGHRSEPQRRNTRRGFHLLI